MAKQESLQGIFLEEIRDLFDAEKQLVKALPKMARSAGDSELENAFREHLDQTKEQVQRLEQIFGMLDTRAKGRPCKGMKGIVEEGQELISEGMPDASIASAARRVEHYEMAGYESARAVAQQLGMREAAQLLQQTLQEEVQADRMLAQISKRLIKESSRGGTEEMEETGGRRGRSSGRGGRQSMPAGRRSGAGGRSTGTGRSRRVSNVTNITADHEQIRQWAEERGAHPACVRGTGGRGDTGMIRLDFPGYSGAESLQPISWDEWFDKFDRNHLALLYQEKTARGQKSNFNKLVSRETAEGAVARRPKARAAR